MPGVRNLTQVEATERARLLDVTGYDINLDLSTAVRATGRTFRSVTEVRFRCAEPGATTFIETAAESVRSATLNGAPVDISGWSAEKGLILPDLAAENVLVVDADLRTRTPARACTASSTRSTARPTSTPSSRRPTPSGSSPASTSPTSKTRSPSTSPSPTHWQVISNGRWSEVEPAGEALKTVHFADHGADEPLHHRADRRAVPSWSATSHDGIDLGLWCRKPRWPSTSTPTTCS